MNNNALKLNSSALEWRRAIALIKVIACNSRRPVTSKIYKIALDFVFFRDNWDANTFSRIFLEYFRTATHHIFLKENVLFYFDLYASPPPPLCGQG